MGESNDVPEGIRALSMLYDLYMLGKPSIIGGREGIADQNKEAQERTGENQNER